MKHRRIKISSRGKMFFIPARNYDLSARMKRIKAIRDAKKIMNLYDDLVSLKLLEAAKKLNICF